MSALRLSFVVIISFLGAACGDGEADAEGIGAECVDDDACVAFADDLSCITAFDGGYCAQTDCVSDEDCPNDSACVTHDDARNYCFRTCESKPDCNANRAPDVEASCVGSITFVDPERDGKACEPSSSGI